MRCAVQPISSPLATAILLVMIIGLTWATLLLCDVATGRPADASQDSNSIAQTGAQGWPTVIDRLMAVPIDLTDVSDLRVYAIPVCLAAMLVLLALMPRTGQMTHSRVEPATVSSSSRDSHATHRARRLNSLWFEGLIALILLGAAVSAVANGTWEISRGYLFFLAASTCWAVIVSRLACLIPIWKMFMAGAALATVAVMLSLWHLYALGERFFQLPVGPITLTAAFGTLWGSMAIAWALGCGFSTESQRKPGIDRKRESPPPPFRSRLTGAIGVMVAVLALWMAWAAGRRGAFLALLASLAFIVGLMLWTSIPNRRVRGGILGVAILLVGSAGAYVWQQSVSPERVASVPLMIRYTYWTKALEMVSQRPLFGHGPDMFICDMTTALARQRAEMPTILHGGVDFDAHNEWVQAIFELGAPTGLAYLALPFIVIALATRAWKRSHDPLRCAALLACIAGVVHIVVAEASSINLRHAMLASWYWTILGLTVGLTRTSGAEDDDAAISVPNHVAARLCLLALAAALIFIVASDLRAALAHGRGRALMHHNDAEAIVQLEGAQGRFGAARWLSTRTYLAHSATAIVRQARLGPSMTTGDKDDISAQAKRAVEAWSEIQARAPGYLDTGFRLAEAQMLSGDTDSAVQSLRDYLEQVNPYDKQANSLLVRIGSLSPAEVLETVLRSLRSDRWDSLLLERATQALAAPEVAENWTSRVESARSDAANKEAQDWEEPLAPEILRVEAFRFIGASDMRGAATAQYQAAQTYRALADGNSKLRRLPPPEAEAWYLAARFLFELDPGEYAEAHRRIVLAEGYAVQGLMTEKVRRPQPGAPYVGGVVMPLEAPDRLRDIWRFAAMMYLAVKGDPQQITLRITWSLPSERHATPEIQAELGNVAAELVQRLSVLPESRRPPSFPRLVELARQFRGGGSPVRTGSP